MTTTDLAPVASPRGDRAADLVVMWLRTRRSEHTRRAYARDLTEWLRWCHRAGVLPLEARHAHVGTWLGELDSTGYAESTRARRLAAVSSWYRWLVREQLVGFNPADLEPGERPVVSPDESTTVVLSTTQVEQLLAAADRDGPRSSALVGLLVYSGARVGELLGADIDDLTYESGHPVLPIRGKGRKRRSVPLTAPCFVRITRYLHNRGQGDGKALPAIDPGGSRPLFVTATGRRLDSSAVHRLLRRLARAAGGELELVADRISPHALRHAYATDLLDAGVPVRDVQYALGHADPRTTERYDRGKMTPARHPSYRRATLLHDTLAEGATDGA